MHGAGNVKNKVPVAAKANGSTETAPHVAWREDDEEAFMRSLGWTDNSGRMEQGTDAAEMDRDRVDWVVDSHAPPKQLGFLQKPLFASRQRWVRD